MLSFLNRIFTRPREINDPVFGRLLYVDGCWEGIGNFRQIAETVEWSVAAGPEGPGELNYSALQSIADHYDVVCSSAYRAIDSALQELGQHLETGIPSLETVRFAGLDVPCGEPETMKWEAYFEERNGDSPMSFFVEFNGWLATGSVEMSL